MKKFLILAGIVASLALSAGSALADSIENRIGVTGRLGFFLPANSDFQDFKIDTDAGFIGGGGLIYGINRNLAVELDVTHTWFSGNLPSGGDMGEFSITDVAMGVQYRFMLAEPKLVPYAGGGLDVLINDYKRPDGFRPDVDTVVGIHAAGGLDYFITRQIALNAEVKAVVAPEADISPQGGRGGHFDPSSVAGTFGVRLFFW